MIHQKKLLTFHYNAVQPKSLVQDADWLKYVKDIGIPFEHTMFLPSILSKQWEGNSALWLRCVLWDWDRRVTEEHHGAPAWMNGATVLSKQGGLSDLENFSIIYNIPILCFSKYVFEVQKTYDESEQVTEYVF